MGFLTTITIHNDALHDFKKNPEAFAEAVFAAIEKADLTRKGESQPCLSYCNYITAMPPRHADDHTVYLHAGNSVTEINAYSKGFRDLSERMPDLARQYANEVISIAKRAKKLDFSD